MDNFFDGWNATYVMAAIISPLCAGWFMKYKADKAHELELKKLEAAEKKSRKEAEITAHASAFEMGQKIREELLADIERKERRITEMGEILENISNQLKEAKEAEKELRDENNQLMLKFRALETNMMRRMEMLENAHFDLPIPQWIKDDSGRVLLINRIYEDVFLKPRGFKRDDYKFDVDVWPKEIAEEFRRNDMWVIINNRPWVGTEMVEDSGGELIEWRIAKYPLKSGVHVIGVIGIAFPERSDDLFKHLSSEQIDRMEQMKG